MSKQTPEQLASLPASELNEMLADLAGGRLISVAPKYCSDWAATGPLMTEYHISLFIEETGECAAYHLAKLTSMHDLDYNECAYNDNPIRAVVECLVLVLQEKDA